MQEPGVPIRFIISYMDSPSYNFNKYIANILKTCAKDEKNNAKNYTTFTNYIRNLYHLTSLSFRKPFLK